MSTTKIMIIRHGEKPSKDGSILGVSANGSQDPEELTVQGWQRAGAIVRLFAPFDSRFAHPTLAKPDMIFASRVAKHSNSLRAQHTVSVLASFIGTKLNLQHAKGEEEGLVSDALASDGNVLIAWEHEAIPGIANSIVGAAGVVPKWPDNRFDLVWVFERESEGASWQFTQIPQMLLPGDMAEIIKV